MLHADALNCMLLLHSNDLLIIRFFDWCIHGCMPAWCMLRVALIPLIHDKSLHASIAYTSTVLYL
jgi:hypothetical protein